MVTTCDPKSYELAEHFLADDDVSEPRDAARLTEQIANYVQRTDDVKVSPAALAFIDGTVERLLRAAREGQ